MDWTSHKRGLDGQCYACSSLHKRMHSCTCYGLSMCEQVTSTLPIQKGAQILNRARSDYRKVDHKIHGRLQNSSIGKILEGFDRNDNTW